MAGVENVWKMIEVAAQGRLLAKNRQRPNAITSVRWMVRANIGVGRRRLGFSGGRLHVEILEQGVGGLVELFATADLVEEVEQILATKAFFLGSLDVVRRSAAMLRGMRSPRLIACCMECVTMGVVSFYYARSRRRAR